MKQRGLKRKCRNMVRRIEEETEVFPRPHGNDYWHLHLPTARGLVASSFKVRRLCVETLIGRAHHLAMNAPDEEETRVIVAITLPDLWASQIIVFFGADYFDRFFDRKSDGQRWTVKEGRLSQQWNLEVPPIFSERNYDEEIREGDGVSRGQIWFIGELEEWEIASI